MWLRALVRRKAGFQGEPHGGDVSWLRRRTPTSWALSTGQDRAIGRSKNVVSRLEQEAGGKVFSAKTDAVTTVLVASVKL